jgi:hypothetical protein
LKDGEGRFGIRGAFLSDTPLTGFLFVATYGAFSVFCFLSLQTSPMSMILFYRR